MTELAYGFIGVGRMGSLMSARLLERGHPLQIYDTAPAAVSAALTRGAIAHRSAAALAGHADVIFLSLPSPEIVQAVALGADGIIAGTRARRVVDFSTIGPRTAGIVARALAPTGIVYVDAPVSGGLSGARDGSLAVMVSCARAVFDELQSILSTFGKVFHLGEQAGQAQTMKLANNLLSAAALALTSEAMVMGVKAGLNPRTMLDVINAGSGRNSASQDKFPRAILPGTFDFGFATGLAYKDVRLCVDEAETLGVPMVVGAAVRQLLAVTHAMYGPDSDFTSICRVIESWAGVEVRD